MIHAQNFSMSAPAPSRTNTPGIVPGIPGAHIQRPLRCQWCFHPIGELPPVFRPLGRLLLRSTFRLLSYPHPHRRLLGGGGRARNYAHTISLSSPVRISWSCSNSMGSPSGPSIQGTPWPPRSPSEPEHVHPDTHSARFHSRRRRAEMMFFPGFRLMFLETM